MNGLFPLALAVLSFVGFIGAAPALELDELGRVQGVEQQATGTGKVQSGGLTLAKPFSDGAVLQRERPVAVWGTAKPGEEVRVELGEVAVTTKADPAGNWKTHLPALPACATPQVLRASAQSGVAEAKDVLVGEVWLVSGQSNAVCPFWCTLATRFRGNTKAGLIVQYVNKPQIRFSDTPGTWKIMNRQNLTKTTTIEAVHNACDGSFSEMGTYFALKLHDVLGVPVGMIGEYVNGSPIEKWIPPDGQHWKGQLVRWLPYTIRGVLWNQGDSNCKNGSEYDKLLSEMYEKWSKAFENNRLSFYFQEQHHLNSSDCFELGLAMQRFAKTHPYAALCGGCDITTSDWHGNDKETMARRMLAHALKRDYGYADIEDESPTFRSLVKGEDGRVVVTFDHAQNLFIYNDGMTDFRVPFELCGPDGKWYDASVEFPKLKNWASHGLILSSNLTVRAGAVTDPKKIRYMYKNGKANIYNEVCLPILSFEAEVK